ncbi:glycogen debranching protein GlgX [Sulfuricystis thermophila]|uniref:glycogen debranching protein GlgX n=1 Tax=Sulfuricystis thermophila TaxID=2496847 RepID=UPI0010358448|nr:glycogen debranching protein GlgX [Sulfuricystis thermophila]
MHRLHQFPITTVWPGSPYPRGATWDGEGVNFALFSEHAEKVELCLFDPSGQHEIQRITLREQTDLVWHCYLPEARPGLLYGYRVHGPYDPARGHRFNPNKLLLDPYARDIVGPLIWNDAHFGYRVDATHDDLSFDLRDNAPWMPKCRVTDPAFSWGEDRSPNIPWHEMVIYELHVRGFTIEHPEVPPPLRGTYAGLITAPVIAHLKRLGITSVELMPIHSFIDDRHLIDQGKRNYWGYNSIGFFAPEQRYSASGSPKEFKTMVKTLHSAGIEVILDVVYNHTAEGNHLGPTLSFKGIDNSVYYRLQEGNPRFYRDYTGCGNTLNLEHPRVLQLVMDSLRYWVQEMHVDGFRFDLAASLGREQHAVNHFGAFFDILHQDPILSRVKLIAEPWDLGEGGYQVGNFPLGWAEWNDRYRDCMRAFWRGDGGKIGEFATRITGSSDLYARNGRRPYASINFITAHDGFTLHDLVSYAHKHNEANGEDNRDGSDNNLSCNYGVEGETSDPAILALRARQKRNLLATLLFSQGVPMILAGDEMGRTQHGNNNAYCQDNPLGWVNWNLGQDDRELLEFVARLVRLRHRHPVFRRRNFFQGRPIRYSGEGGIKDIHWLKPDGADMTDEEWTNDQARCLGVYLSGEAIGEVDRHGRAIRDDNFILLFNAHVERIDFVLPRLCDDCLWQVLIDTHYHAGLEPDGTFRGGERYPLEGRGFVLLRQQSSTGHLSQDR